MNENNAITGDEMIKEKQVNTGNIEWVATGNYSTKFKESVLEI